MSRAAVSLDHRPRGPGEGHRRPPRGGRCGGEGRPTLMFLTKEAVRLATGRRAPGRVRGLPAAARADASAMSTAGGELPGLPDLLQRPAARRDHARANAALGGTVPMWEWIGDEPATTFSY